MDQPPRALSLDRLAAIPLLVSAWEHVERSDATDGVVAPSVARFASNAERHLEELRNELVTGSYRPRPLTPVRIPKRRGTYRELHIPSARDRVVERALQQGIQPVIDPTLSFSSYGYRPGLGVLDAIRRVVELREDGWRWVIRTDIADCFPSVDRNRLLLRLEQLITDPALLDVVATLIRRPVRSRYRLIDHQRGIPQGGALSPLLSNLMLDEVDRYLLARGHQVVRYADDLVITARTEDETVAALAAARLGAEREGFKLGKDKTMTTTFDDGFYFLGEEVNAKYPAHTPTATRSEPTQRALYVGLQGSHVRIDRGRLVVAKGDDELMTLPTGHVERVVLSGAVGLSSGARSWALNNDIDVVLLSRRGSYLGILSGGQSDSTLLRAQLAVVDDPQASLAAAKAMVAGKLRNQRTLLTRFVDPDTAETVATVTDDLLALDSQAGAAEGSDVLLGIEGMAARRYWEGLRVLLPDVGFEGRHRRPPPDLVNAALGYGYAILLGDCTGACHAAGLHPSFGLLHREADRRPALALDLMEEFRPLIVDQVVAELVRRRSLTLEHTRRDTARGGTLLTEKGRQRLTAGIEDRLLTMTHHLGSGHRVSYRRAIRLQAAALVRLFRYGEPYEAITWR